MKTARTRVYDLVEKHVRPGVEAEAAGCGYIVNDKILSISIVELSTERT